MPFREKFEYDIFLSYGWGGSADPNTGSREWAKNLRTYLENNLPTNLKKPQIFLDEHDARVGPIEEFLYGKVASSAIFILAVSPGSCRPDSWCQKEIGHFWDTAFPLISDLGVMAPEDRIFKAIQSVPDDERSVEPLTRVGLPSFNLYKHTKDRQGRITTEAVDPLNPEPNTIQAELAKLLASVRTTLERIDKYRRMESKGKVFLGATFSDADDKMFREVRQELLLDRYEVRSVTPLPRAAETEKEHRKRVESALEGARMALHIMPEPVQAYPDWDRSHAAQQIRSSLRKTQSGVDDQFRVYLWLDPDQKSTDPQCRAQLKELGVNSRIQNVEGMGFGDLKINVRKDLARKIRRTLAPDDPAVSYDVVIDHWDLDTDAAAELRDHIINKRGLVATLAIPKSPRDNDKRRDAANQEMFYSKSERFLVLYGRGDDLWAHRVCFAVSRYIDPVEGKGGRGALVLLAPPPDKPPNKRNYKAPVPDTFTTVNCLYGELNDAVDKWLAGQA